MIDLKTRGAPDAIMAYGCTFLLDTDFRKWLDFPQRIKDAIDGDHESYRDLFLGDAPLLTGDVLKVLDGFYYKEPIVPRDCKAGESVIDFDIDADLIFAAFLQSYGIDLVDCDLHWHKFSALLNGLPQNTILSEVIGYRTSKDDDKRSKELRYKWALPAKYTDEEQKQIDEFNKVFG